jgi:transposase
MDPPITITHERVDDIPLIIGTAIKLGLPDIVDAAVGRHGLHQGLGPGWLATIWIAYILSEGDHRKSTVQDWANSRRTMLGRLIGQDLREVDFTDDRLGILLRRLSDPATWDKVESELWRQSVLVYDLTAEGIRLDSTTSYGYHSPGQGGVMQLGYSKDHRPDLPQLKLMAAAAEPSGQWVATEVHPGNSADDPLYLPLIERVRRVLGRTGLLYIGDCKMAALATRASIVAAGDVYLTPAPETGNLPADKAAWLDAIVAQELTGTPVGPADKPSAMAYGFSREQTATLDGEPFSFTERVILVRSRRLAEQQVAGLEARLAKAERQLLALTPPVGRGRRQLRHPDDFLRAVKGILDRPAIAGLLSVTAQLETDAAGLARFVVTAVTRDEAAIAARQARLGWRVLLTTLSADAYGPAAVVEIYNRGWLIEQDFHLLKDRPLGIQPLYVQTEAQITGLTHLLTLALRLLTLIQTVVRRGLGAAGQTLAGLFPGQASRSTDRPTGRRLLQAFTRAEISLIRVQTGEGVHWHLTPLPQHLVAILTYLGLSPLLYTSLAERPP